MKQQRFVKFPFFTTLTILFSTASLCATHNVNRYYPFLERPENYRHKNKPTLDASFFHTTASTSFNKDTGTGTLPDLYGRYDLRDINFSLKTVRGDSFTSALDNDHRVQHLLNKTLLFKNKERLRSYGLTLRFEYPLPWYNITIGAWMPFLYADAIMQYKVGGAEDCGKKDHPLSVEEKKEFGAILDQIRRGFHDELCFTRNCWSKAGIGDIDLYIRANLKWDYRLWTKSIDLAFQAGVLIPTGNTRNRNNPASVPFGGNDHWGLYFDFAPEIELKHDLKIGLLFGAVYQFNNIQKMRIPTYQESSIFSALVSNVEIDPGFTFKLAPYITFENLMDGLHFQARYNYIRHSSDEWTDVNCNPCAPSFLTRKPNDEITQEDLDNNQKSQENLTRWRYSYLTLQVMYDAKMGFKNWCFNPIFYVSWDMPIGGRGVAKTHQLNFGVEFHF